MRHLAPFMRKGAVMLCVAGLAMGLAACQSAKQPAVPVSAAQGALPTMERIALGARACWFRSKDPAFAKYRLAPELTSMTGKPRILIVPAKNPNGLPLAVVEATGNPARLQAFGPLMGEQLGDRIRYDVNAWANGRQGCPAAV
jgi:hypothetical protein